MGAVATFSYPSFAARYPEFSGVAQATVNAYWTEATLYLDNTGAGPVQDPNQQAMLLNMLTAHIAAMNGCGANGQGSSPLVGRISNASEGSVSVAAEMGPASGTSAWYLQTKYGAAYWQAVAQYRRFLYVPGCQPQFNPPRVLPWYP